MTPYEAKLVRNARLWLAIAVLNFLVCAIGSLVLGGDALSGKIEDGQAFVGWKGQYTPVPWPAFFLNAVHRISVGATHLIAAVVVLSAIGIELRKPPK